MVSMINITLEISVLPKYLRLGGPPGLIHWNIVAAWPKIQKLIPKEAYVDI